MSVTSFNRSRRQNEALADAKARDDAKQNTPLNHAMDARQLSKFAQDPTPDMASPPYPDIRKLVNIPSGSDMEREIEGAKQSELNKVRVLSEEARNELQNAHLRDDKVKAIPDHDEAGQDRSQQGMAPLQQEAYKDYEDPRAPQHDGRIRATEEYSERPDVDTTVSKKSATKPVKLPEDDKSETVGKIAEKYGSRKVPRAEVMQETALEEESKARKEVQAKAKSKQSEPRPGEPTKEEPVKTLPQASSNSEVNKDYATKPADAPKTVQPGPVPGTAPKEK
jgi:hypothetical protein